MSKDSVLLTTVYKLMRKVVQNVLKIIKLIKMVYAHHMILIVLQEIFMTNVLDVMMDIMLIRLQNVVHQL